MGVNVHIQIFTQLRLFERLGAERLFDALEEKTEVAPTHWGESASLRDPYDRAHMLGYMQLRQSEGLDGEGELLVIRRLKNPKYNLETSASYAPDCDVTLSSVSRVDAESLPLYFDLGSRLAAALEAEYGFVDIEHEDIECEDTESGPLPDFQNDGPGDIRRRTFFGHRLLDLMGGVRVFEQTGLVVRSQGNVLEADIATPPWNGDGESTLKARRAALKVLRKTGVFYTYNDGGVTAGPRWVPLPPLARPIGP